jgi:hypothetical protein
MSDQPHPSRSSARKFSPDVDCLERRRLLSRTVSFPDGASFIFPTFLRLPRTGGALIQSGTALTVGVGQRTSNTVRIENSVAGTPSVEWNGRAPHLVAGFQAILVQAGRATSDRIRIDLGSMSAMAAASTSSTTTAMGSERAHSHVLHAFRTSRTGVVAIQTGTVLTINDTARKINQLAIESWNFGHMVQPQWNGSGVHTFTDVNTIIVVIRNGNRDFVALDNAVAKGL